MGNNGSHAPGQGGPGAHMLTTPPGRQQLHWQNSLPTDPHLKASHLKVLPDLDQNPRLRSTNNGAILQSGGTISGRRPLSLAAPHDHGSNGNINGGVYRSKSITQESYEERVHQPRFSYLSNQRDPLHRSHTHLHLDDPQDSFMMQSKRFGSEPDLRNNPDVQIAPKSKVKNFKKKYKAPPPPQTQGSSSPDSWNSPQAYEHQVPQAPSRKLRLFKTRAETKKTSKHNHDIKPNGFVHAVPNHEFLRSYEVEETRYHPNDIFEQSRYEETEKLFRSPSRDREEHLKYPSSREEDMIQSHSSLKREEKILQTAFSRQEVLRTKHSQQNMYREKARQAQESKFDSNKEFRSSERFKKQNNEPVVLRREKSFDNSLVQEIEARNGVNRMHNERKMLLDSQNKFNNRDDSSVDYRYNDRKPSNDAINKRKSVPNMPVSNGVTHSDFQAELKLATRKLRNVNRNTQDKSDSATKNRLESQSAKKDTSNKTNTIENKSKRNVNNINESKIKALDAKLNNQKPAATQSKTSNIATLDRSKLIKPKVIEIKKKEETKIVPKGNSTNKVNPGNKNNVDNNLRNRRESRVMTDRGQASGKESTPEQSPSRVKPNVEQDRNHNSQPSKSFYFGMDKSQVPVTDEELDVHEKVRRHLEMNYNEFIPPAYNNEVEDIIHITPKIDYNARLDLPQASSESALSSEPEPEDLMSEENNPHGIALQLRPTLPKKQLEIPRFSPAAAWRQLASLELEESFTTIPPPMPNPPAPTEEKIRRQSQPHRWARPERGSHDKSGDSGISGDAGPNHDDAIDAAPHSPVVARREEMHKRPLLSAWTPQQDLEEESSSDPGNESPHSANTDNVPAKFSARQQVFSLSLPRESHAVHLGEKNKQFQQPFNSLQKLKKSVSGAIGVALGSKKVDETDDNSGNEQTGSNWFLSRSAPNSLNNALNTPNPNLSTAKSNDSGQQQTPPSSDQEDDRMPPVVPGMMRQQPPFSYLATGGHVMYLPQYDSQRGGGQNPQDLQQPFSLSYGTKDRPREAEQKSDGEMDDDRYKAFKDGRLMSRSKSSGEIILTPRNPASKPRPKGKRFTFQSTVRQIERKRLAEKLSKEAESKERQRLSELEAMRRVEEEFQRKRAREKASIRQQLRLVSLDESCSSLPSSWGGQGRAEPEGAVSPSPPPASRGSGGSGSGGGRRISGENSPSSKGPSPSPKIGRSRITNGKGNEYREPREYKDYRRAPSTPVLPPAVHPPACYNMPRVGRAPIGSWEADPDNYRREFARGRRPPSSSGSDLSQGGRLLTPPRW